MFSRNALLQNGFWLLASLALAFFVWIIATTQNDPITQRAFVNIPVQIDYDDGLIVLNSDAVAPVRVLVRARQSVNNVLTSSDITVRADLRGLGPGSHTVELQVRVSRPASPDPSPRQYTIELAQRQARQKPVVAVVTAGPPTGFTYEPEAIVISESQVIVSGSEADVDRVEHLAAEIDLSDQRSDTNADVPLRPLDARGLLVEGVELAQQTVNLTVPILEVPGEFEITVVPDIDYASLPAGYQARLESFSPQRFSANVPPELAEARPTVIYTERIDLAGRTERFTAFARLVPIDGVTILNNQPIEITIAVQANIVQRIYEGVPLSFLSQNPDYTAEAVPSQLTVVLTGPQPVLDALTVDGISAVVDLTGLGPGRYDLPAIVTVNAPEIAPRDIRVLTGTVGIIITENAPTTPTADGE